MNEVNHITNTALTTDLCNSVVGLLLHNKLVDEKDLTRLSINIGYLFSKSDGVLEGLLAASYDSKVYYFALQNNDLKLININEAIYKDTIAKMKEYHECLRTIPINETEAQKLRRVRNNDYLTRNDITINEHLVCSKEEATVHLKSIDEVCKRAIANLITIQVACDINNGKDIKSEAYKGDLDYVKSLYIKFGVENSLNSKEKRIINGTYTSQDSKDLDWEYEAYWALCWCLGLVDSIKDGGALCDCNKAIFLVFSCKSFDDFKSKCKMRSIGEILDMYDLYYRYDWAINNKYVDLETKIGNLNPDNVIERRRALEWILSDVDDWHDLKLNT